MAALELKVKLTLLIMSNKLKIIQIKNWEMSSCKAKR